LILEANMSIPNVALDSPMTLRAHRRAELPLFTLDSSPLGSRLLLATDGSREADGAVSLAFALARARPATVEVLSVLPLTTYGGPPLRRAIHEDERRAQRRHLIDEQLGRISPLAQHWPVDLDLGTPCSVIAAAASARFADLVIMGLSRHTLLDRVFRDETTLRVMRRLKVPLLAVAPALHDLPRRVVVAVDFSRSSIHAARIAAELVASGGELHLVHVEPPANTEESNAAAFVYTQGVGGAFEKLIRSLNIPPSVRVTKVMVEGMPYTEMERVLSRARADLLALGTTRHDLIERVAVGRMTSAFTREANISLLAAPPDCRVGTTRADE
jgi:nucleotide-binding universal stress UspA family protein